MKVNGGLSQTQIATALAESISQSKHVGKLKDRLRCVDLSNYNQLKKLICDVFEQRDIKELTSPIKQDPMKAFKIIQKMKITNRNEILEYLKLHMPHDIVEHFRFANEEQLEKMIGDYVRNKSLSESNVNMNGNVKDIINEMKDEQRKMLTNMREEMLTITKQKLDGRPIQDINKVQMNNTDNQILDKLEELQVQMNAIKSTSNVDNREELVNGVCWYHRAWGDIPRSCVQGCRSFDSRKLNEQVKGNIYKNARLANNQRGNGNNNNGNRYRDNSYNSNRNYSDRNNRNSNYDRNYQSNRNANNQPTQNEQSVPAIQPSQPASNTNIHPQPVLALTDVMALFTALGHQNFPNNRQ